MFYWKLTCVVERAFSCVLVLPFDLWRKILSWYVKMATQSIVQSPLLLSKICVRPLRVPFSLFLYLYLYGSPLLLWNILFTFWMHVDMGSAYMCGLLGDFLKDTTHLLFGKWSNPDNDNISCWLEWPSWKLQGLYPVPPHNGASAL